MFNETEKVINMIYASQKSSSKKRGHKPPTYNRDEFYNWILSSEQCFSAYYNLWIYSKKNSLMKPSVDRKDNDKGYTLDNIQLMTWGENKLKGYRTRKSAEGYVKKSYVKKGYRTRKSAEDYVKKGYRTHLSQEIKDKISETLKGVKHSEERRNKLKKPQPRLICPGCGKEGAQGAMKRWHLKECNKIDQCGSVN